MNKLVSVLAVLVLCGVVSAIQPGCRTRYEMKMKWAVQGVSNSYWECKQWGSAVRKTCPVNTYFAAPYQTCVPAKYWEDFPYYEPPTSVNNWDDECIEIPGVCVNPCDIECNGGDIIDGKCVCPPNFELVNGTCKYTGQEQSCENGVWNPVEEFCKCNDGYQLVDGKCVAVSSQGVCEGAPDTAYAPGTMDCKALECTYDEWWANRLFPTRNPTTFWQCGSIGIIHEMPCAPGTCFDFNQQVCVHPRDWVNFCN